MSEGAEERLAGALQVKTFYNSACAICLKARDDNQRCAVCKSVKYCGKQHQKEDWKDHKGLCKAIAKTNEIFKFRRLANLTEYNQYRVTLWELWEQHLERKLRPHETLMWMFPSVCEICFVSDSLFNCKKCWCVSYCSREHMLEHSLLHDPYCNALKLSYDLDVFLTNNTYIPAFVVKQIDDKLTTLPLVAHQFLEAVPTKDLPNSTIPERLLQVFKAEAINATCTMIYALERMEIVKQRMMHKDHLVIHIVGVACYEARFNWSLSADFLFHWVKNLKTVQFILVGPDAEGDIGPLTIQEGLCEKCQGEKKHFTMEYHKNLYDQVVNSLTPPNLVTVFNCGFHEYESSNIDTWQDTIPTLLKHGPLCITAYTQEEMASDFLQIQKTVVNFRVYDYNIVNPYRGGKPNRNWVVDYKSNMPVYYTNHFISILAR